jgi:hypothetical protein
MEATRNLKLQLICCSAINPAHAVDSRLLPRPLRTAHFKKQPQKTTDKKTESKKQNQKTGRTKKPAPPELPALKRNNCKKHAPP